MPVARKPGTLVVLGGSSPFAAALIDSLRAAERPLTPRTLVLQGRDAVRLALGHIPPVTSSAAPVT